MSTISGKKKTGISLKKILILFAHPALQKSRINNRLIEDLGTLDGVKIHDLYQAYPEFDIDIQQEQALLTEHDIIVMHHPFFWYSTPAILKEWQDLVLSHGWAFGSEGNELKGKIMFNALTAGGSKEAYSPEGYNRFTIRELLAPLEQTARLCKMIYLPPFAVHGTHAISQEDVLQYKQAYRELLTKFRDDRINISQAEKLTYLNEYSG